MYFSQALNKCLVSKNKGFPKKLHKSTAKNIKIHKNALFVIRDNNKIIKKTLITFSKLITKKK